METENRNRKEYTKSEIIFGNLAIIFWISLGAAACGIFYPLAAIAFFALVAFLIFFEIGKHGCVTCYYCKTCTIGMGKLPELFFKSKGTANVNRRALKLFPFVYVLLSLIPIVLLSFSLIQELITYKLGLLVGIFIFSTYTGIIRRKNLI
jgi:hypothetical protein